jgi:hypothetical protein
MRHTEWDLLAIWNDKDEIDPLRKINAIEATQAVRNDFLDLMLHNEAIRTGGCFEQLWGQIEKYPRIYGDTALWQITTDRARKWAADLMLGRDPLVYKRYGIHTEEIDGRVLHYHELKDSISQQGIHVVHGAIGSGKSELIIQDIKSSGDTVPQLIVVPSVQGAKDLAEQLGPEWHDYHRFGTKPEDIKRAIRSFNRLVICAGSVRWFREMANDIRKFKTIYVDEMASIIKQGTTTGIGNAAFQESLEELFELISLAKRTLLLSADITERNTLEVLGRMASDSEQSLRYYKTNKDYIEGSSWGHFEQEFDLIWETINRLNRGERGFGVFDFADIKSPRFTKVVNFLKKMCPEKKIEAYTRDSLADSFKGQTLTAMGLQDYIKHRIDGDGLDCFICSPIFRDNISILHEEERYHFDFSFGIHRGVNDPNDAIQGHRRDRLIKDHLIHIKNHGTRLVTEQSGQRAMTKDVDPDSLERARIGERTKYYGEIQNKQLDAQNKANRQWLTKLHLESRGARNYDYKLDIKGRSEKYNDLRTEYREMVLSNDNDVIMSSAFHRGRLFNEFVRFDSRLKRWVRCDERDEIEEQELIAAKSRISGETAERLRMILTADEEILEIWSKNSSDAYFKETGYLLHRIFSRMSPNGSFQGLSRWYIDAATGSTWYGIIEEEDNWELTDLIVSNYHSIYKPTLGVENKVTTLGNFITRVIAPHLELEIWTNVKNEKKMEWRLALYEQYKKQYPGKFGKRIGWTEFYEEVETILKAKIMSGVGQSFSNPEERFLDTLKDVIKVRRPNRPIYSKIWQMFNLTNQLGPMKRPSPSDDFVFEVVDGELEEVLEEAITR